MSGPNFESISLANAISGAFTSRSNILDLIDEGKAYYDLLSLDSLMISKDEGFEIPAGIALIFTVEANEGENAYTEDVFLEAPKNMTLEYVRGEIQKYIDSKPHKNGIHRIGRPEGW